jgi:hypothetical protein
LTQPYLIIRSQIQFKVVFNDDHPYLGSGLPKHVGGSQLCKAKSLPTQNINNVYV